MDLKVRKIMNSDMLLIGSLNVPEVVGNPEDILSCSLYRESSTICSENSKSKKVAAFLQAVHAGIDGMKTNS